MTPSCESAWNLTNPTLSAYLLAPDLAIEAKRESLDIVEYGGARYPDLLESPQSLAPTSPADPVIVACKRRH